MTPKPVLIASSYATKGAENSNSNVSGFNGTCKLLEIYTVNRLRHFGVRRLGQKIHFGLRNFSSKREEYFLEYSH